jgi:UDP-N-acetylglucosamine transferase subunit ALG13
MIFVTVGSDIPFDRLVRAVDRWAGERGRKDVFAQIGRGGWVPGDIPSTELLEPLEFKQRLLAARIVVAHAGMGTILSALQLSKPILVMPRRGPLGETRNDHQLATARHLLELDRVHVAFDEHELAAALDRVKDPTARKPIPPFAPAEFTSRLHAFIHRTDADRSPPHDLHQPDPGAPCLKLNRNTLTQFGDLDSPQAAIKIHSAH